MTGLAAIGLLAGACTAGQEAAPERDESLPPAPTVSSSQGGTSATGLPEWEARSGLSIPRDDFATATVGEEIWVFGGMTGDRGNRLDSIEVYDTRTERWRMSQRTVPEGLASFEGVSIGDRVFIFGGLDANSDASDFSAVFDTSTGDWRRLPPLPRARYAHTVTLHDGLIYVIGGEAASGPVEHVDIYDPAANKWTSGAAMPQARGSHDAVSAGEAIYVLGGWLDSGPSDLVQTYLPGRDTWAAAPRLPEPVSRAGATVLDGRLWVSLHEFSYVLDLADEKWSPANPLTLPRHGLGYVAVGGSIYGIGGCSESPLRDVRTVDVLDVR